MYLLAYYDFTVYLYTQVTVSIGRLGTFGRQSTLWTSGTKRRYFVLNVGICRIWFLLKTTVTFDRERHFEDAGSKYRKN